MIIWKMRDGLFDAFGLIWQCSALGFGWYLSQNRGGCDICVKKKKKKGRLGV
jgi:hypothetical protein